MTEIITETPSYLHHNSVSNLDRKLFVGGLSWDTTERDILGYFGQYGYISNVTIKHDSQTGNSRCFGFITFASDASIDAALQNCPHLLNNKQINLRKARTNQISKKIFVGGLCPSISQEIICDYFCQYGKIEGVELPFDRVRNRRREFCFVIFENEESADKACYASKQNIGECQVDVKKAQPYNQVRERKIYPYTNKNRKHYFGKEALQKCLNLVRVSSYPTSQYVYADGLCEPKE